MQNCQTLWANFIVKNFKILKNSKLLQMLLYECFTFQLPIVTIISRQKMSHENIIYRWVAVFIIL